MDILPDISKSKDNDAMKVGHLIEHNVKNNFLQVLYRKWGVETSSRPLFALLNNLYMKKKQLVSTLVSI